MVPCVRLGGLTYKSRWCEPGYAYGGTGWYLSGASPPWGPPLFKVGGLALPTESPVVADVSLTSGDSSDVMANNVIYYIICKIFELPLDTIQRIYFFRLFWEDVMQ